MISFIPTTTERTRRDIGELASVLARVAAGGVTTIPSAVISKEILAPFLHKRNKKRDIQSPALLASLKTIEDRFGPRVDVRASFDRALPGFPEYVGIRNSVRSLTKTIGMILEAWFDDRFEAFRIVQQVEESETYPSLLIQTHARREWSLTSREPVSGKPLTDSNCDANVGVCVKTFRSAYTSMLKRVETLAGFPVQIVFTETPEIQLCRVEKETMTGGGALAALASMRETGVLDTPQMLLAVEQDMLAKCCGGTFVTNPECVVARGCGLPASAGHATGKAMFRKDPVCQDAQARVFVCEEVIPEDVERLRMCRGLLASMGGMTSHAALIMRGWGRPAVVSAGSLKISKRGISVDGNAMTRDCYVHVDGATGTFAFSLVPLEIAFKYTPTTDRAFLVSLREDLHSLTFDQRVFSTFSVEEQLHLANLTRAFATIGLGTP